MLNMNNFILHKEPILFLSAIEFTAARTGFQPELIEKDYYCTLILKDLTTHGNNPLIFKGGTLLAKVHAGFYRLSEDLDFSIPVSFSASRKERSLQAAFIKPFVNKISERLPVLTLEKQLTGSDESKQYNAEVNYESSLSKRRGRILIEIGLRDEMQTSPISGKINTLLLNPFNQMPYIPQFNFQCLTLQEAYAEKMRAALTRKKLAIRDFYDLDYALKNNVLHFEDKQFIQILKAKLSAVDFNLIEFDDEKLNFLRNKVFTELMPTLNQNQVINFNIENIISMLKNFATKHLTPVS